MVKSKPGRKAKGTRHQPETYSFRINDEKHRKSLAEALNAEKEKHHRTSISNTIEVVLLQHFNIIS